jgi:hypothetical protein
LAVVAALGVPAGAVPSPETPVVREATFSAVPAAPGTPGLVLAISRVIGGTRIKVKTSKATKVKGSRLVTVLGGQ